MTQEWIKALELERELYYPYFEEELEFLKKEIKGGNLVDLGCGDSRISRDLKGHYSSYLGVDIDPYVVQELSKNKRKNTSYSVGNICQLELENELFDTSLCLTTYSNFGNQLDLMLKENNRILKPQGVFIGSCYHENALEKRLKLYKTFGNIIKKIDEKGNVFFKEGMETDISCQYSQEEVENQLKKSGFQLQRIEKSGPFYLFKGIKS